MHSSAISKTEIYMTQDKIYDETVKSEAKRRFI